MIAKNDWDAALDGWVAAEQERLGGPPTPEEVAAYTLGELTEAEAARVRALLVYYPELTSLLTDEECMAAPAPQQWRSLSRFMPVAAGLLIALLTLALVQSRAELARTATKHQEPHVHQTRHELQALRPRGGPAEPPAYELPSGEERYLLSLRVFDEPGYRAYRLEIVHGPATKPRTVWTASAQRSIDGTFDISIPRELIGEGTY